MSLTKDRMFLDIVVPELNLTSKTECDKRFLKEFIYSANILSVSFVPGICYAILSQNRGAF